MPVLSKPTTPEIERLQEELRAIDRKLPKYPLRLMYLIMFGAAIEGFDRSLLAVVLEDVRRTFHASDARLGLLAGAFAFFASLSIIPLGILTDRVKRVRIISLGYLPWGIAMILQGIAPTFGLFFLARVFNGSMEATNGVRAPAPVSLVSDYYPVEDRSRLFGVYGIGQVMGFVAGPLFGGITAAILGWRAAFAFWGLFGIGTGVLLAASLPEPPRGLQDARHLLQSRLHDLRVAHRRRTQAEMDSDGGDTTALAAADAAEAAAAALIAAAHTGNTFDYRSMTKRQATREVTRVKTFWFLVMAEVISVFGVSGAANWLPTFYRRYHGMSVTGAAVVQGLVALSALVGVYGAGRIGDVMVRSGRGRYRAILVGACYVMTAAFWVFALLSGFTPFSVHFFFLGSIGTAGPLGLLLAVRSDLFHAYLRGRAASLLALFLIFATFSAPITFGFVSDLVGLRSALLGFCPFFVVAGVCAMLASRTYDADIAYARAEAVRQAQIERDEEDVALAAAAALADSSEAAPST